MNRLIVAAMLVEMQLPPILRSLHQAVGTLVWVAVVGLSLLSRRGAFGVGVPAQYPRLAGQHDLYDFFGVIASGGEFGLLWIVAQENGELPKNRLRQQYDGTLFYELEAEHAR